MRSPGPPVGNGLYRPPDPSVNIPHPQPLVITDSEAAGPGPIPRRGNPSWLPWGGAPHLERSLRVDRTEQDGVDSRRGDRPVALPGVEPLTLSRVCEPAPAKAGGRAGGLAPPIRHLILQPATLLTVIPMPREESTAPIEKIRPFLSLNQFIFVPAVGPLTLSLVEVRAEGWPSAHHYSTSVYDQPTPLTVIPMPREESRTCPLTPFTSSPLPLPSTEQRRRLALKRQPPPLFFSPPLP